MLIRVGSKIINTDNVVEVEVKYPDFVVVKTTALQGELDVDGTGYVMPYDIILRNKNAGDFLKALPTYTPTEED